MKVTAVYIGKEVQEYEVQDLSMQHECLVLKIDKEVDMVIPFNNVRKFIIDKQTPRVVRPDFGGAA